jgi:excisionase family DNA binding protein
MSMAKANQGAMPSTASVMTTPIQFTLSGELLDWIAERVVEILQTRQSDGGGDDRRRWMTVAEAAEYLRCSPQRIYDLRSARRLSRHGDGSRALVDRHELDRLAEGYDETNKLQAGRRRTHAPAPA